MALDKYNAVFAMLLFFFVCQNSKFLNLERQKWKTVLFFSNKNFSPLNVYRDS